MRVAMNRALIAAVSAGAGALVLAGGASAPAETPTRLGGEPQSWAFAIGNGTLGGDAAAVGARYAPFDVVVVDGEEAKPEEIAAIQAGDGTVLAYLSVGTIEKWRGWYRQLKPYRLRAWQDWKDEWFADISKRELREQLVILAQTEVLDKGFDGLFLDNTDMVEARRHKDQRKGMAKLIEELDGLVEESGGLLFTQNGHPGMVAGYPGRDVDPLIDHFDGWNREDVSWTYDFDRRENVRNRHRDREAALAELEEIGAAGLETTATDYVELGDGSSEAECEAVANAAAVGALPYVANIGLTRKAVAANPPDC